MLAAFSTGFTTFDRSIFPSMNRVEQVLKQGTKDWELSNFVLSVLHTEKMAWQLAYFADTPTSLVKLHGHMKVRIRVVQKFV